MPHAPLPALPEDTELRVSARFDTVIPVEVQGLEGRTRNISASGVYFETDVAPEIGSLLTLTVELTQQGQARELRCKGRVVRVDAARAPVGVAVELLTPFFGSTEEFVAPSAARAA
jgi:hypothetical protein